MCGAGFRDVQADPHHGFLEQLAIFTLGDRFGIGADQSDLMFFQNPGMIKLHGTVESRLPAQSGQECIWLFPLDDLFQDLHGDRFNVSPGSEFGIGHDGGRIGIHQNHFVSLFFQSLAGLNSRVVKLAPLADDDGPGTN